MDVFDTDTHLSIREEFDARSPRAMPHDGFAGAMNVFIATIYEIMDELHAKLDTEFTEWARAGKVDWDDFVVQIENGQEPRNPTYGDIVSAGFEVKKNIDHFAITPYWYKEVQVWMFRTGALYTRPLAIMEVFFTDQPLGGSAEAEARPVVVNR